MGAWCKGDLGSHSGLKARQQILQEELEESEELLLSVLPLLLSSWKVLKQATC